MSYALTTAPSLHRTGLFGLVVALHVVAFALITASKTVAPQILEMPLIVDLIAPVDTPKPPESKPYPLFKPQAPRQTTHPKALAPVEASTSIVPAPASAVAAQAENKPTAPLLPASEPISHARFDADTLKNPAPGYPALSRRMGEEGKVILRVSVTPQGTADSVEIKTSSGSARLDEAAQKTVRTWKFIPAKRGDTSMQSWVLVPIIFKLEQ